MSKQRSCYLIGRTTLLIKCAEVLLLKNYQILGVCTQDPEVISWLAEHCIVHYKKPADLLTVQTTFDYIFSIINDDILPEDLINRTRKLAINYHDALLPKYAGLNSTSWAILNKEKRHGVTFHLMTTKVDQGDIVKQMFFPIEENDTAFSLNLKAYQAAQIAFAELLADIDADQVMRIKQNLQDRTYYSATQQLPNNGFIDWRINAEDIIRLYAATYFGEYNNPVGLPKVIIKSTVFIVGSIELNSGDSEQKPGFIKHIDNNKIVVVTGNGEITITKLVSLQGKMIAIEDLREELNLKCGDNIQTDFSFDNAAVSYFNLVKKHESYWVKKLLDITPVAWCSVVTNAKKQKITFTNCAAENNDNTQLAVALLYLYRLNNSKKFCFSYVIPAVSKLDSISNQILANKIVDEIDFSACKSLADVVLYVDKWFQETKKYFTYTADLSVRYKNLKINDYPEILSIEQDECGGFTVTMPATAFDIKSAFNDFFENLLADLEVDVHKIAILSAREQYKITQQWNDTNVDYHIDSGLHIAFEQQVKRTPTRIAIRFSDQCLTYQELNQQANHIAHYLLTHGVVANEPVGICMDRSIAMVVAMLGVLKAGGAYLPLDPAFPAQRLAAIVKDSQLKIILSHSSQISKLPQDSCHLYCVDLANKHILMSYSGENPQLTMNLNQAAYVIYTSGSTGNPKGVVIEHRAILNRLCWMQQQYNLTAQDVVLQKTPYNFDVSVWEFFWPLINGAELVVAKPEGHKDPRYLIELINSNKISVMHFVPCMLNIFLEDAGKTLLPSLKKVFCSGEELPYNLVKKFFQQYPDIELHNLYGPTEAAIDVSYYDCRNCKDNKPVPIGKPIANTQLYILDKNKQILPVGIPGELYIGGVGLARCYLNQPELTATKFIASPFGSTENGKLYTTGDLAYFQADGNIVFLGRIDNQVKIRGLRLELGEIETALTSSNDISAAVVIVGGNEIDPSLIAYIVPHNDHKLNIVDIKKYLAECLPDYMLPNQYIELAELPLTSNGKVDRKALPKINNTRNLDTTYVAAVTQQEKQLAIFWQEILIVNNVGIDDDFFALGGNSLSAMRLNLLLADMGYKVKLIDIFNNPTIRQQVNLVSTCSTKFNASWTKERIDASIISPDIPASHQQQRLWFLTRLHQGFTAYHMLMLFKLSGNINVEALEHSLKTLIKRHAILRTVFAEDNNGTVKQVIQKPRYLVLDIIDFSGKNLSEVDIHDYARTVENTIFDLQHGPLFKAQLIKINNVEHYLVISLHHIIADGWSLEIIKRELAILYNGYCSKQANSLSDFPVQYADFAIYQQKSLHQVNVNQSLKYWLEVLAGDIPVLQLPFDYQRPEIQDFSGKTFDFLIPKDLAKKTMVLIKQEHSTLYSVLATAFYALLFRYSNQTDIIIGAVVANRLNTDFENMIGYFANTLALRADLSGQPSFRTLLKRVQAVVLDALSHQETPIETIIENLNVARDLRQNPLFQVMLVLQNTQAHTFELSNVDVKELTYAQTTAKFDLTLFVKEDHASHELYGQFEYNSKLFCAETIQRLSDHFIRVLTALTENIDHNVAEFSLLTFVEYQQRTVWNETAYIFPQKDQCLQQLFEQQVDRQPIAEAVITSNKRLTYLQLEQHANRIAHHLQNLGAQPNKLIAVVMEKGWEQIVAVLAILKAGAAYLPITVTEPEQRIHNLLAQGEVDIVLTQASWINKIDWPDNYSVLAVDNEDVWVNMPITRLPISQRNTDLAYVIFTSGSTGTPKGVMIDHRGAVNTILDINDRFSIQSTDCVFGLSALNFDLSVYDIFGSLAVGAKLVLPDPGSDKEPKEWLELFQTENITVWNSVPTLMQMLVEKIATHPDERFTQYFSKLKLILLSGDWIPLTLPMQIKKYIGPHAQVISLGGATEASIWSVLYPINTLLPEWKSIPYGKPMRNQQFHILNSALESVPVGVLGELYIGGIGVAQGYWQDAQRSNNSFIYHPNTKQYLYKTGDLGRYLSDGTIEFGGRIDNQVKIRGFRIELGEIEAKLVDRADIDKAVVVTIGDQLNETALVAYVTPAAGAELINADIINYLSKVLPAYMVPQLLIQLDSIPLSSNGKIDRKALPAPDFSQYLAEQFVAPKTETQISLATIWSSLLNVPQIGLNSNFFTLGGHSLLIMRMMNKIREKFNAETPVKKIFEYPTLGEFSDYLTVITDLSNSNAQSYLTQQSIEEGVL